MDDDQFCAIRLSRTTKLISCKIGDLFLADKHHEYTVPATVFAIEKAQYGENVTIRFVDKKKGTSERAYVFCIKGM